MPKITLKSVMRAPYSSNRCMNKRFVALLSGLAMPLFMAGCSTPENRPVPWVKAKVYETVEMTGILDRGTYIRVPDYYSSCSVPTQFYGCQNYYLHERPCMTPMNMTPMSRTMRSCHSRVCY